MKAARVGLYVFLGLAGLFFAVLLLALFGMLPGLALWAAQLCLWDGQCAVGTSRWGHVSSTEVTGWLAYALGALYLGLAYLFGWLFLSRAFAAWRSWRPKRKKDRARGGEAGLLPVHVAVWLYLVVDTVLVRLIFR